jgi:hypothetical protein
MKPKYLKTRPFDVGNNKRAKVLLRKENKVVIEFSYYDNDEQHQQIASLISKVCGRERPAYHLCGYVAIHKSKIPKEWRGWYDADGLQYLDVHGGITYAEVEGQYCIFGLDCAHYGDDENPDMCCPDYVMALVEKMEEQLLAYSKVIKKWRRASTKKRIEMLEEIRGESSKSLGMGAMIDMLGGARMVRNDTKDDS